MTCRRPSPRAGGPSRALRTIQAIGYAWVTKHLVGRALFSPLVVSFSSSPTAIAGRRHPATGAVLENRRRGSRRHGSGRLLCSEASQCTSFFQFLQLQRVDQYRGRFAMLGDGDTSTGCPTDQRSEERRVGK